LRPATWAGSPLSSLSEHRIAWPRRMQLPQAPPNGLDPEVGYMSTLIEGDRVNALSPSNMVQ